MVGLWWGRAQGARGRGRRLEELDVRRREGLAERDVVLEFLQAADDLREALADGLEDLDLVGQEVQRRHCFVGRGRFARGRLPIQEAMGVRSRAL